MRPYVYLSERYEAALGTVATISLIIIYLTVYDSLVDEFEVLLVVPRGEYGRTKGCNIVDFDACS